MASGFDYSSKVEREKGAAGRGSSTDSPIRDDERRQLFELGRLADVNAASTDGRCFTLQ